MEVSANRDGAIKLTQRSESEQHVPGRRQRRTGRVEEIAVSKTFFQDNLPGNPDGPQLCAA